MSEICSRRISAVTQPASLREITTQRKEPKLTRRRLFLLVPLFLVVQARSQDLNRVGDCIMTTVESVSTRLEGVPDSGSSICFKNGICEVGYDTVAAIEQSKKGDPVRMCLVSIERGCPKGMDPIREYRTTNLRLQKSWTLGDQSHSCKGA
jgi:hypothetical protein